MLRGISTSRLRRHLAGTDRHSEFRHPDYEPLDIKLQSSLRLSAKQLWVIRMVPTHEHSGAGLSKPPVVMSNIRVRYTVNSQTEVNIGSAVKTFQVVNQANVPCVRGSPCSPDGSWKASAGSESLDAGAGNEFKMFALRALRGHAPYSNRYQWLVNGGRNISVSVSDWSDTATSCWKLKSFIPQSVPMCVSLIQSYLGERLLYPAGNRGGCEPRS